MLAKAPRGTRDILPEEVEKWSTLEAFFRNLCKNYNYREIRTPIFEHTELFSRSVGEDTDIVGKEMYTFFDKGKRSMTLRPEGTASTVRAFLEHKLYAQAQPTKLFYFGPMFRYDRPQAGRYRQFHQLGAEVFGSVSPEIDTEVIALAMDFFHSVGLNQLSLEINSVGCPQCRPIYREEIQKTLDKYRGDLCPDCQGRFENNPLRILDCKVENCQEITETVPDILDHLCSFCVQHFEDVVYFLKLLDISYHINPKLVRGLDYYTKTAFEIVDTGLGSQNSLGGGGRYDGLVETCGGSPTPGVGFAIGVERVLLSLEQQNIQTKLLGVPRIFVAALGTKASARGLQLMTELRRLGIAAEKDYQDRSLKAQMKQADRVGASIVLILGEEELEKGKIVIRDMVKGDQQEVDLEGVTDFLRSSL
ncbi:histidine--tRNA ligase [Candidatus Contubernalis alkaliaceticus]|uniref:histidine--tRNA ligase n=1 Tax=Candidatus Contubernalis alkaliaceticus TaxID=338645 RepID=UPI001F4BFAD5|nr:histidine--tRNA ligase [Candidatus Contubernalis alkalaceticus]UNC92889.1 histidine--tRNA ligase [Candidatus Contubernalis alkalaceticus]